MREVPDRLQFIIKFAVCDLHDLAPEERNEIEDHVLQMAGLPDWPTPSGPAARTERLKQAAWALPKDGLALLKQLPKLQAETRNILDNFLNPHFGMTTRWTSLHSCKLWPKRSPAGGTVLVAHGRGRDMFLLGVFSLLTFTAARRIQRCPECRRFFLRSGKQKFCTRVCTNKSGWRNWSPEKKEEARRKQYEKAGWTRGTRGGGKLPR